MRVVTDLSGFVVDMDPAAAALLNVSMRHAQGRSLLPYVEQGRLDVARDLQAVSSVGVPVRAVTMRPRERRPFAAHLTLRPHADGVEWFVDVLDAFPPQ